MGQCLVSHTLRIHFLCMHDRERYFYIIEWSGECRRYIIGMSHKLIRMAQVTRTARSKFFAWEVMCCLSVLRG